MMEGKENTHTGGMKNSLISPHPKGWWKVKGQGDKVRVQ